jgi:hypothetical protein
VSVDATTSAFGIVSATNNLNICGETLLNFMVKQRVVWGKTNLARLLELCYVLEMVGLSLLSKRLKVRLGEFVTLLFDNR